MDKAERQALLRRGKDPQTLGFPTNPSRLLTSLRRLPSLGSTSIPLTTAGPTCLGLGLAGQAGRRRTEREGRTRPKKSPAFLAPHYPPSAELFPGLLSESPPRTRVAPAGCAPGAETPPPSTCLLPLRAGGGVRVPCGPCWLCGGQSGGKQEVTHHQELASARSCVQPQRSARLSSSRVPGMVRFPRLPRLCTARLGLIGGGCLQEKSGREGGRGGGSQSAREGKEGGGRWRVR